MAGLGTTCTVPIYGRCEFGRFFGAFSFAGIRIDFEIIGIISLKLR